MAEPAQRLSSQQLALLEALTQHDGEWHHRCDWSFEDPPTTVRMLEVLRRRGLVTVTSEVRDHVVVPVYRIVVVEKEG